MVWPATVLRQFELVPTNPNESDFHGAYNKLLYYLFPVDTPFTVVPQYLKARAAETSDWIVTFEVLFVNRPVFILELKKPADIHYISSRQMADDQIRRRMTDLAGDCPIPTLHAVSAIGTRLCFYTLDTTAEEEAEIRPINIPRHPTRVNDTAPGTRWDCDIVDPEGEARLRAIVDEISQGCANLT